MFSRAAVCQIGSSSGSSSFSREPSVLRAVRPKPFMISPRPSAPALMSASSCAAAFGAEARSDVAESDVGEHHEAVLVLAGANRGELLLEPFAGRAAGVDHHLHVDGIHRRDDRARSTSSEVSGRRMAVDVDDRKLRARDRVLRHDQRRSRLVLADVGWRDFGLAPFRRTRPDLPRRLLRAGQGGGQDEAAKRTAPERMRMRSRISQ